MDTTEAGVLVEALWSAVSRGGKSLEQIPGMIKRLLETGAWRKRTIRTGKIVEHTSFYSFLTTPPLNGCGYDPAKILKLISDDAETLVLWREAMKRKQGDRSDLPDNVSDVIRSYGNSLAYTVTRLKSQRPDLFDRVNVRKTPPRPHSRAGSCQRQPTQRPDPGCADPGGAGPANRQGAAGPSAQIPGA
jgi:hypothetical protein